MSPAVGAAVLPELDPSWAVEPETTNTPSPRVVSDERRHLVVVPEPPKRAARGPFLLLIGGLLVMGLVGLLLLNTALAQGSFQLHDLRIQQAALADQEQALLKKVSAAESPEVLAKKAKAIGMVPSETPVFLRLSDGKVLGKPKAAHKPAPKVVAKKASKKPAATTPTTSTAKPVTTTAAKPATTTSTQKKPAGTTPLAPRRVLLDPAQRHRALPIGVDLMDVPPLVDTTQADQRDDAPLHVSRCGRHSLRVRRWKCGWLIPASAFVPPPSSLPLS